MSTSDILHISPPSAHALILSILASYSIPAPHAPLIADSLLLADLRGVDTHGINRLPGYLTRIKHNVLNPSPSLPITQKTPVMALLDAENGFGFVAACTAVDKAVEMAATYGVGIVAVKHSNHYGMAATYLLRALEKGFACFAFTNASRAMPPWGAREPLLGTSPFAVGVPGGKEGDFVLDMSPSVAARGKIRKAARRGEKIPEGYALDEHGRPTTDAEAALKGVVLPIGGPKGSGLAMMMDIFGGVMTGAAFAGNVNDQYKNLSEPQDVGHWFMVFRPEVFLDSKEEYLERMDELIRKVRACERADGVERIYTSGEIERELEEKRRREGIPYTRGEVEALNKFAEECGVEERLVEMGRWGM